MAYHYCEGEKPVPTLKMIELEEMGSLLVDNTTTFDNLTFSCAADSVQNSVELPYSAALLTTVRVIQSLFWLLLFLGGSLLNGFVIFLVAKFKKLQTLSFSLALQIVAQDLLLAVIISSSFISSVANKWILGEHVCAFVGAVFFTATTVRTAILLVFVIDRFFSVFCPFAYPKHQKKVAVILSISSWLFACLIGLLGFIFDCINFKNDTFICSFSSTCNSKCSIITVFVQGAFASPATILPVILYIILFIKARKAKKAMVRGKTSEPEHNWKATITFFLLFITAFILILPTLLINSSIRIIYQDNRVPAPVYIVTVLCTSVISLSLITDPILIMRNRDVREAINKMKVKIKGKFSQEARQEAVEMNTTGL